MESLHVTYGLLLKEKISLIKRRLLEEVDINQRLICVKGSRGVGKTNFLLEYSRTYFHNDNSCLYLNTNNLFIHSDGIIKFVDKFYNDGGRVLLMDQVHKYPHWDNELAYCYNKYPDLRIVFTVSSTVRISSNPIIGNIVNIYRINGLSFREFIELETAYKFPSYNFEYLVNNYDEIYDSITSKIQPLVYFENYMKYGYYPIHLEEKSYLDYLLKNINLMLEFDIPYNYQVELSYLPKLKKLLYIVCTNYKANLNITKLSAEIGVSRATIQNYLTYMKDARLLTLIYDSENSSSKSKKLRKVFAHNPNLLNAICLDKVEAAHLRKTFFLSQVSPFHKIEYVNKTDILLDSKYKISFCDSDNCTKKCRRHVNVINSIRQDCININDKHNIPLWLVGFLY